MSPKPVEVAPRSLFADSQCAAVSADQLRGGQVNLLEYALATDPRTANISAFIIAPAGDGALRLHYPRRTGFTALRYTVLRSDDLLNWSAVENGLLDESAEPVPGQALEMVTGRIVDVAARAFFRLAVETTSP